MKKTRKATAVLLLLVITAVMLSGCSLGDVFLKLTNPDAFDWQAVTFSDRGYPALKTEAERKFYAYFDRFVHNGASHTFRFDYTKDTTMFARVSDIYLCEHPEVFWVDNNDTLKVYSYDDKYMTVQIAYTAEGDALQAMQQRLENEIQKILSSIPEGSSDYDKELLLNDWLVDNVSYLNDNADAAQDNRHNAYGALVEKGCVCDGYSAAFKLLCDRVGIDCSVVLGTAETDGTEVYHAWNAVCLDGEWYHIDVTWNDSSEEALPELGRYFDFNLTTEQIKSTHKILPLYGEGDMNVSQPYNYFLPECTAVQYNYFRLNCETFNDVAGEAFANAIAAAAQKGEKYFAFNVPEDANFNALRQKLLDYTASRQLQKANAINGGTPKLSPQTYIYHDYANRILILTLTYL